MTPENMRLEQDLLGSLAVPKDGLYGIHTARALDNFPLAQRPVCPALVHAFGAVKLAAAQANQDLGTWSEAVYHAIARACTVAGRHLGIEVTLKSPKLASRFFRT